MKKLLLTLLLLAPFLTKAQITLIPDPVFEQYLIGMNIDSDGLVNGQILTSDAQIPTQLNFGYGGDIMMQNLTGLEDFVNVEYIEGYYNAVGNTMNLTTLIKLKTLIFPSNWLSSIDLSTNINLEYLVIGNGDLEFMQYNYIWYLDLSNNTKLEYLNAINLYSLRKINLKNHNANKLKISLGWSHGPFDNPHHYTVCIEVDDPVAATNKVCTLSIEKFVNENFKIYPNPATDYVSIEQKETNGVTLQSVQILDSSGKWIKSIKDNFNQIDVSNLSKGIYLFVIQTDKGNKTEMIVIK